MPEHLDPEWLKTWIQPHHLNQEACDNYLKTFQGSDIPILHLKNFLTPNYAEQLYIFMSNEAYYKRLYGIRFVKVPMTSKETWLAASEQERFFTYSLLQGGRSDVFSTNSLIYMKLRYDLSDPRFIAFFQHITGLTLSAMESIHGHAFSAGDYLRPHNDRHQGRRLAFIIYLNSKWDTSFGGALHIKGHDGQEIELACLYNSLVVFDVEGHQHHYVGDINEVAGTHQRLSLGGWYK